MADRAAPINANTYPVDSFRELVQGLVPTQGVVGAGDMAVTALGTPGPFVQVAAGAAFLQGIRSTVTQGTYHFLKDAAQNYAIAAGDPTNPRRDLVCAVVTDSVYAVDGTPNIPNVRVVTGTPAGSPVDPTPPATWSAYVILARVRVAANVVNITNAMIDDLRPRAALQGGQGIVTSSTRPGSPYTGQTIFETDTKRELVYDGTAWRQIGNPEIFGVGPSTISGALPSIPGTKLLMQAGSSVMAASSGAITISFPVSFPNGILSVVATVGDVAGTWAYIQLNQSGGLSLAGVAANVYTAAGASVGNNTGRVNWIAIGW